MLPEEIKRLLETIQEKLRQIIQMLDKVLHFHISYVVKVTKLNNMSHFTQLKHACSTVQDVFMKPVN